MSEKGMDKAKRNLKEANISNEKVNETDLEEELHKIEEAKKIKKLEEEKKSKSTSPDAP